MAQREVMISNSVLRNRDGVDSANVGDRIQMVETEKGLRHLNLRDRNAKRVDMRVVDIKTSTYRDRKTGKLEELQHLTLREEG